MESGPGSWRVSVDPRPTLLHEALFVRDAAGLLVESTSEIPARLRGDIPDRSGYFSMDWRASAGVRWTSWWHELVRWAALPRLVSLLSDSAFTRRPPGEYSFSAPPPFPVGDQEDESSVTELQRVLELAAQWSPTLRTELRGTRGPSLFTLGESERIGSIARETAARLGVPLEAMRAVILTLAVSGEWSHRPLEGVLLCSESAMENEDLFATLLADTFVTGLYRQERFTLPDRPAPSPAFRSILDSPLLIADGCTWAVPKVLSWKSRAMRNQPVHRRARTQVARASQLTRSAFPITSAVSGLTFTSNLSPSLKITPQIDLSASLSSIASGVGGAARTRCGFGCASNRPEATY